MRRSTVPFDDSWRMPIDLKVSRAVRCDGLILTCGQVDLDSAGRPQRPGDLWAQSERAVAHLLSVLEAGGAGPRDLAHLHVFYRDDGRVDWPAYRRHLCALLGADTGPLLIPTPVPAFFYPGVEVEIDAVAVLDQPRRSHFGATDRDVPLAVRFGDLAFVASAASGAVAAVDCLQAALADLAVQPSDLVKVTVYMALAASNRAQAESVLAERLGPQGPAQTMMCLPRLPGDRQGILIEGIACDQAVAERVPGARPESPPLAVRRGGLIFLGSHIAAGSGDLAGQTHEAMAKLSETLKKCGADLGDLAKVNTYYVGSGTPEELHANLKIRSDYYRAPGPASTGMPVPGLRPEGALISIDGIAILARSDNDRTGDTKWAS